MNRPPRKSPPPPRRSRRRKRPTSAVDSTGSDALAINNYSLATNHWQLATNHWQLLMAVRFEIYRDGQRVTQYQPVAAVAVGPESVIMPADVQWADGVLHVNRDDEHALGLAILWNVGSLGEFHLETTRLPHRLEPYVLNVELCRFRLMKIIQKQEDWNLFDFPGAEKQLARFREAQAIFSEALAKLD